MYVATDANRSFSFLLHLENRIYACKMKCSFPLIVYVALEENQYYYNQRWTVVRLHIVEILREVKIYRILYESFYRIKPKCTHHKRKWLGVLSGMKNTITNH